MTERDTAFRTLCKKLPPDRARLIIRAALEAAEHPLLSPSLLSPARQELTPKAAKQSLAARGTISKT